MTQHGTAAFCSDFALVACVAMSTRKLILTALVCGIAIVLAGGIKLLQVANETTKVTVLGFGDSSTLGDMTVSVLDITAQPDRTVVTVLMSGVEGADAREGWRMLAGGKVSEVSAQPWTDTGAPACSTTTERPSDFERLSASSRVTRSGAVPMATEMMMRMGRVGQL